MSRRGLAARIEGELWEQAGVEHRADEVRALLDSNPFRKLTLDTHR